MKVAIVTFSPTGGTQKVAETLAAALGGIVRKIDLCDRYFGRTVGDEPGAVAVSGADVAVVAVPSFSGRVPVLAAARMKCLRAPGVPTVVVAVYGNREFEDTLVEAQDILQGNGFEVVAGVAAVAQHSIATTVAAGRPDVADEAVLHGFARRIAEKIRSGACAAPAIPGNRPYRQAGQGPVPVVTDACAGCGACVERCPAGAIAADHPELTDANACMGCMRCVAECPSAARRLPAGVPERVTAMLTQVCPVPKENRLYL